MPITQDRMSLLVQAFGGMKRTSEELADRIDRLVGDDNTTGVPPEYVFAMVQAEVHKFRGAIGQYLVAFAVEETRLRLTGARNAARRRRRALGAEGSAVPDLSDMPTDEQIREILAEHKAKVEGHHQGASSRILVDGEPAGTYHEPTLDQMGF